MAGPPYAGTMKKLAPRHALWVMPFFLTVIMTCLVSFISAFKGVGFGSRFVDVWLGAWGWSWLIAFPVVLVVLPLVKRMTALLVDTRAF